MWLLSRWWWRRLPTWGVEEIRVRGGDYNWLIVFLSLVLGFIIIYIYTYWSWLLLLLWYYYYYYIIIIIIIIIIWFYRALTLDREKEVEVGLRCNTLLLGVLLGPSEVFCYAVQEFRRGDGCEGMTWPSGARGTEYHRHRHVREEGRNTWPTGKKVTE